MRSNSLGKVLRRSLSACLLFCASVAVVYAQTDVTLFNFANDSTSGGGPLGPLTFDSQGNLYGVTIEGGGELAGTVFTLTRGTGGWTQNELFANFESGITASPNGGLVFDSAGNLYGTSNANSVWKLTPSSGGPWTLSVLHQFIPFSGDGDGPTTGVVLDDQGNIYGTTKLGGTGASSECPTEGCGTVFELTPGANGQYTETILYSFQGGVAGDGSWPRGVIRDGQGNLYGVTQLGGFGYGQSICNADGCGTVYELSPDSSGQWKETQLYVFQGAADGSWPMSLLTPDGGGTVYGTTYSGGLDNNGTIFKLQDVAGQFTESAYSTWNFKGLNPGPGVVTIDKAGQLFAETSSGPPHGNGMVFEFNVATEKVKLLDGFPNTAAGTEVNGGVILRDGNLFGVTESGGTNGQGTVFEITP
jgi:uncharacterized repeat protein (TIGR03803 family)